MSGDSYRRQDQLDTAARKAAQFDPYDEDDPDPDFSMDEVAAAIQRAGYPAYATQTGGGTATLYAGEQLGTDDSDLPVHPVTIGPGVYTSGYYEHTGVGPAKFRHTGAVGSRDETGISYEDGYGDSVPYDEPDPVGWLATRAIDALGKRAKPARPSG